MYLFIYLIFYFDNRKNITLKSFVSHLFTDISRGSLLSSGELRNGKKTESYNCNSCDIIFLQVTSYFLTPLQHDTSQKCHSTRNSPEPL